MDFDLRNFEEDVLARSHKIPVLVDFWAPWCGPCKYLSPILEKLALKANHYAWELIKINSDENPEISVKYNVRSIPTLKLFFGGKVKAELTGALPEEQLTEWINRNLPSQQQLQLEKARNLYKEGEIELSEELLVKILSENPDFHPAQLLLARCQIRTHPEQSIITAHKLKQLPDAEDIEALSALCIFKSKEDSEVNLELKYARLAYLTHNFEEALEHLIQSMYYNKSAYNDLARKAIVAIFRELGENNDLTRKFRRKFSMALH